MTRGVWVSTPNALRAHGVHHNELEDAKLIEYAAMAESASSHPISKSEKNWTVPV